MYHHARQSTKLHRRMRLSSKLRLLLTNGAAQKSRCLHVPWRGGLWHKVRHNLCFDCAAFSRRMLNILAKTESPGPCQGAPNAAVRVLRLPNQVLSQPAVTACHSNLSQLVTVAAGSIWWGRSGLFRSRGLGPFQPAV